MTQKPSPEAIALVEAILGWRDEDRCFDQMARNEAAILIQSALTAYGNARLEAAIDACNAMADKAQRYIPNHVDCIKVIRALKEEPTA